MPDDQGREFKAKERKQLAGQGKALPGGGFPIKTVQDLKNAIQAFGRAKDKAKAKAHIIARAKALGATNLLPAGWTSKKKTDSAELELIDCPECERAFLDEGRLAEHAEAVHTFNDIERLVNEAVREKFSSKGTSSRDSAYAWVNDLADDWVVFSVEKDAASTLYKASYGITDGQVTLGEPYEVRRRTVYEKVEGSAKSGEA